MSLIKQISDDLGFKARCTPAFELRVVQPYRLAGGSISGSTLDPNFATGSVTGSGSISQSNGVITIATGTTANSTAKVQSTDIGRYVDKSANVYGSLLAMGDTGTTNNTRRWGAFNGTDGCYFKLSGTTLSVCTMKGGVETAVASSSWNGSQTVPTLTNYNFWAIEYRLDFLIFEIGGVVAHSISAASGTWTNVTNLPIFTDNVNSGGSTTNVSMSATAAAIYRLGPLETQAKYFHDTGAGTHVLKYSAGTLQRVVINTSISAGSTTITMYDNTSASGSVIASVVFQSNAQPVCLEYHIPFNTGLTIVTTASGWDFTVVYE